MIGQACRFHRSYKVCSNTPLTFRDELSTKQYSGCISREWTPSGVNLYDTKYSRILETKKAHYCTFCEDDALGKVRKSKTHPERLEQCQCQEFGHAGRPIRWVCVPCFKRIYEAACEARRARDLGICENDGKVEGCSQDVSFERAFKCGICRWCGGTMDQVEEVLSDGKLCYEHIWDGGRSPGMG